MTGLAAATTAAAAAEVDDLRAAAAARAAEAEHDAVRRARVAGMSAELAAALVDGEPCTVCGSVEHPAPAAGDGTPVDAGTEQAAAERAGALVRRATTARAVLAGRVAEREAVQRELARSTAPEIEVDPAVVLDGSALDGLAQAVEARQGTATDRRSAARQARARAEALGGDLRTVQDEAAALATERTARADAARRARGRARRGARRSTPGCGRPCRRPSATRPPTRTPPASGSSVPGPRRRPSTRSVTRRTRWRASSRPSAPSATRVVRSRPPPSRPAGTGWTTPSRRRGRGRGRSAPAPRSRRTPEISTPSPSASTSSGRTSAPWAPTRRTPSSLTPSSPTPTQPDAEQPDEEQPDAEQAQAARLVDATSRALAAATARLTDLAAALVEAQAHRDEAQRRLDRATRVETGLRRAVPPLRGAVVRTGPLRTEAEAARALADLCAGANDKAVPLSTYVLAAHLEHVVAAANQRLHGMSDGRYALVHVEEGEDRRRRAGLGLAVLDAWTGVQRPAGTLSGGETFLASLALALGLADVVTAEAGGVRIDALFVDEGFGTLDPDSLDRAVDVLDQLQENGRMVGVVSHVGELRQRLPRQVHVEGGRTGSTVRVLTG